MDHVCQCEVVRGEGLGGLTVNKGEAEDCTEEWESGHKLNGKKQS